LDAKKTARTSPIKSIQAPKKAESLTDSDSADTTKFDSDNESDTANKNTGRDQSKKNYNKRRKSKQKTAKVIAKSDPDRTGAISQAKLDGEIRSTALSSDEGVQLPSPPKITSTNPELSIDFIGFEIKSDKETMQQLQEPDEDEQ
jgi:hypothetical protein